MVGCRVVYVHFSDALRDLLPFVKFKKREKHAWNSVTFSKVSGCSLKVKVLRGCLSRFLKCANGTNQQFVSYLPCNRGELHGRLKTKSCSLSSQIKKCKRWLFKDCVRLSLKSFLIDIFATKIVCGIQDIIASRTCIYIFPGFLVMKLCLTFGDFAKEFKWLSSSYLIAKKENNTSHILNRNICIAWFLRNLKVINSCKC